MDTLRRIALALVVIGAVNWGLIGLFQFDLVATLFGGQTTALSRIIYALVGLSGLITLSYLFDPVREENMAPGELQFGTEFGDELTDVDQDIDSEFNSSDSQSSTENTVDDSEPSEAPTLEDAQTLTDGGSDTEEDTDPSFIPEGTREEIDESEYDYFNR